MDYCEKKKEKSYINPFFKEYEKAIEINNHILKHFSIDNYK